MGDPVIECVGVSAGYAEVKILEDINLTIERGEIVALLGGSGSGKSTLLRALTGLQPPQAGDVKLFGESIYQLEQRQRDVLLRRTGMLFQQDALFGSMTVVENVVLPLRELTRLPEAVMSEMARMKLALVGLAGLEDRMPSQLSGGQRKRAALARASVLDPEIIFCDEPSAGLDPVVAAEIDEALMRFRDVFHITIVAVTHELESIKAIADRAVMLGRGTVCAAGTIEELSRSSDPDVYNFFHRLPRDRVYQAPGELAAAIEGSTEPATDVATEPG